MSKIHDLQPDKPASDVLTPAQVSLYVTTMNAKGACEACGSKEFTMCPESDGSAGMQRGLVWLACDRCNAVRTFLRPPIVAWLRGARSA